MKTHAWMLCCLGLLAPLQTASADEPPQGFVKITLGVEGEGLERIPVVGPLLKQFVAGMEKPCAEQVQLQLPPPPDCPARSGNDRGVPMLSKVPYVARLFKNVGPVPANQECETVDADCPPRRTVRQSRFVGPDGLERIGVDFDFDVTEQCAQCQAKRCAVTNAARATAVCPPANEWKAIEAIAVPPLANSPAVAVCQPPFAGFCEILPGPPTTMHVQSVASRDELLKALMEARVEAAVAQTALKVREESDAKQLDLIKELLSSQVENARLTAKLELAAEKERMLAELHEARVELALLQAEAAKTSKVAQRKRHQSKPDRVPEPPAEMLR